MKCRLVITLPVSRERHDPRASSEIIVECGYHLSLNQEQSVLVEEGLSFIGLNAEYSHKRRIIAVA